uniref:Ribosome maturation protein SDO1/SBDS N-terminal domain-containing protein n=1 Tax=Moniliophthora roreri TaxID=221103 RepID=A0A0W0GAN9_MONRR
MRTLTKVIYKPDSQSTDEYIIIVNPEEYNKWKDGGEFSQSWITSIMANWFLSDTTIPLADVVDSFQIFHSNQGNQGILRHASKQQLENEFGSSKDIDVVQKMLERGKSQPGKISTFTFQTNAVRGSMVIDNKGGRSTTGV